MLDLSLARSARTSGECVMSLGINKDLEPLARRVRRDGGSVVITRRNHVVWTMSDGHVIRTGLTMNRTTAHHKRREVEKALDRARHKTSAA